MSNLVEHRFPDEFSEELKSSVMSFIESGMPGLSNYVVDQKKVQRLVSQYLQGYSVEEIATSFSWPNEVVGFLVYKHGLSDLRKRTLEEFNKNLADKIRLFKLKHIDFLIKTADNVRSYYEAKLEELHNKGAPNRIKDLSELETEWIKIYFKIVDSVVDMAEGKDAQSNVSQTATQINLQLPENSKIKKEMDGSVSIVNEKSVDFQKAVSDILAHMAELKRQAKGG
jgi:glutamyl/glutaminyl-tRNA synthetase